MGHPTRARSSCMVLALETVRDTLTGRVDAKKPGVLSRVSLLGCGSV